MKRFHVSVAVADLDQSIRFYRTLFGQDPTVVKDDYAKWMLEDPRVNFALSASSHSRGVNHVGLQADTLDELGEIQHRLHAAGELTFEQPDAECCYAHSSKTWEATPTRSDGKLLLLITKSLITAAIRRRRSPPKQ